MIIEINDPVMVTLSQYVAQAQHAISASYAASASFASMASSSVSASYAGTASYALSALSASWAPGALAVGTISSSAQINALPNVSASYAVTAAFALTSAGISSTAQTASYIDYANVDHKPNPNNLTGSVVITGSLNVVNSIQSSKNIIGVGQSIFTLTGSVTTGIFAETRTIFPEINTGSVSAANIEYVVRRAGGVRIGMVMGTWNAGNYAFTDISSTDVGDTIDISTNFMILNDRVYFQVNSVGSGSGAWTVQTLYKLFPM